MGFWGDRMFNLIKKEIKLYYLDGHIWHEHCLVKNNSSCNYKFKKDSVICTACYQKFPSFFFIGVDNSNRWFAHTNRIAISAKEITIQIYRPFFRWLLGKWV